MALWLTRDGFEVTVANNGVEALAHRRAPSDVVLIDWMMAEMDELEACAGLEADPATRDIPWSF